MTTTRVLVAARLSRVTDPGQSRIERDDEAAEKWATGREGCTIVAVSKDAGVSGAVSPWKRPSLGKWLTDPTLMATYDEIVASSIDRLGRSARDLHELRAWAEDHGKRIRILSPALVWPPDPDDFSGPIVWDVLSRVAEIELRLISKRVADQRASLRASEALVGKPPFGFRAVGEKGSKTIEPVPALVPVLREMVRQANAGTPLRGIARWLNEATDGNGDPVRPTQAGRAIKVAGRKGSELWSPTSVANILRNPALKGRRYEGGQTVLRFDGILTSGQWAELQANLPNQQHRGKITSETPLLTGVLRCGKCDGPMYRIKAMSKAGGFNYRCKGTDQVPSTCANAVPLDDIETWVDAWFTTDGPFARTEIVETIMVPGDDHADDIAEVEAELRSLNFDDPDFASRQAGLLSERARLIALPTAPPVVTEQSTGRTVGQVWADLDQAARRAYLVAAGVTVKVVSSAALRAQPGAESRWIEGDPHKVIGTVRGIVEAA